MVKVRLPANPPFDEENEHCIAVLRRLFVFVARDADALGPRRQRKLDRVLRARDINGHGLRDLAAARRVYHTVGLHIGNDACVRRARRPRTAPARTIARKV